MTNNNNVTDHDQSSDVRYDIDFQIRKRLAQAGLYDEYVLEIHGNITTTKINPDVEQDSQDIGCINARLIQMGRMINDGANIFELYDSFDQYLHDIYGELFDVKNDEFTETLQRQFKDLSDGPNILLIDNVQILPQYRGKRFGLATVYRTIDVFGPWNCLVIIPLYPPQFCEHRNNAEWKKKMQVDSFVKDEESARARLEQYWCLLGFEKIWDSRYICALCTNNKYPSLEEVCPDF